MPRFDMECQVCGRAWEAIIRMTESCPCCPECDSRDTMKVFNVAPAMRLRDMGWEYENNGRGRYISQLADGLRDPKAFCRSRTEAKEKARAKGYIAEDT